MKTDSLSKTSILRAAELLKMGQLVAFPTETVYGLGAHLFDEGAIGEIFRVKKRPPDNPLIAHIARSDQWEMLADDVPASFHLLARAFFPGPLTLIVTKNARIPLVATGGLETIAIRLPDHPIARSLIECVGAPLFASSANVSGRPSSTTAQHVLSDFDGEIAAVLDAGPCLYGVESTVIDLVSFDKPTLVRTGAYSKEMLESVIEMPIASDSSGAKPSPGMRYRHYGPRIPVCVYSSSETFKEHLKKGGHTFPIPPHKLRKKNLYSLLRYAEEMGYDDIAVDCSLCNDLALIDRLEKMHHTKKG